MSPKPFNFKQFFKHLEIPPAEQPEVEACLRDGIERYHVLSRHEPLWSARELLGRPYLLGYGVAEVTRSAALSRETQLKIVHYALQQMRPLEDDGILHGLPILLSFLAGAGTLDVDFFVSAMQLADIQGHLFDDWQAAEAQRLLDWLIAKTGLPEAERLWWVWYLLAHCDKPDLGRTLMRFCVEHSGWPVETRRALCQAVLARRADLQPPASWSAARAAFGDDEDTLPAVESDLPSSDLELLDEAEELEIEIEMERTASLSLDVISSLFRGDPVRAPTYLKRPAVAGLVTLGEDPLTVCRAWLGKHSFYTDAINQGVADIARAHSAELAEADLRDLIERALQIGEVKTRKAFYELGADLFGPNYLTRAAADNAKSTRDWAARRLAGPGEAELPARSKAGRKRKSPKPETLEPGDAHA